MDNSIKKKLEASLLESTKDYVKIDLLEAEKAKALAILSKEIKVLSDDETTKKGDVLRKEKHDFDINRGKAQNELEKKRHEHQVKQDSSKLKLETEKVKSDVKAKTTEVELNKKKYDHEVKKATKSFELDKKKFEYEKKKEDARMKLEQEKFNFQLYSFNEGQSLERIKLEQYGKLDEMKIALEKEKLQFEREKLEIEKLKQKSEEKNAKRNSWITTGLKVAEIVVPLMGFLAAFAANLRLIYIDDGRSTPELRDTMNKIYRK